jgi:hypothetical protein
MFAPLLGDVSTGEAVGLAGVVATVVGLVQFLINEWSKRKARAEDRQDRNSVADRTARREEQSDALTRMENLLTRVERQLDAAQRENSTLRVCANRATVRAERAVVWIKHLESRLRDNKIPFDPWAEGDDGDDGKARPELAADGGYP